MKSSQALGVTDSNRNTHVHVREREIHLCLSLRQHYECCLNDIWINLSGHRFCIRWKCTEDISVFALVGSYVRNKGGLYVIYEGKIRQSMLQVFFIFSIYSAHKQVRDHTPDDAIT